MFARPAGDAPLHAQAGRAASTWRRVRGMVVVALAALGLFATSAQAQAGFSGRWIATFEGVPEVGVAGDGGVIYDFRFSTDGTVEVHKSTGTYKKVEQLRFTEGPDGITLAGGTALPELDGATFRKLTNRQYEFKLGELPLTVRPFSPAISWIHGIFLFFFLVAINEWTRYSKNAAIVWYFVLPIVLIPLWLHSGFDHWFRWVKLYSAVAGAVFFSLMRFTGIWKKRWARITVAAILAINIAEAVKQDLATWLSGDSVPNLLNATAGILNIITISAWLTIHRDPESPHDMLWPGMTKFWIIAYDIWNICFVYMNFPNTVWYTIIIIVAPTVTAFYIREGTWMQARAYTLTLYMMYLFTFKRLADNVFQMHMAMPLWRSDQLIWGFAILSLAVNVAYAFLHFRWRFTGKAPASIEVGQNESATGQPIPPEARLAAA